MKRKDAGTKKYMNIKSSKFKNRTIPYAKVGRRVFTSLSNAEIFCFEHELDADSVIEYGETPELKKEIQEIARYQKAILREVMNRLDKQCAALREESGRISVSLEHCHPLDRGYLKYRLNETVAKNTATHEAREMTWTILEELEKLADWRD